MTRVGLIGVLLAVCLAAATILLPRAAGDISGDGVALQIAAGMNDNSVDTATGASSQVLLSSPNADETDSLRSTRSLANLLAACLDSNGTTAAFLAVTKPVHGPAPT